MVPPLDGDPLLIDPRREDPLALLWLDLSTFLFVPAPGLSSRDVQRVEYTRGLLGLNTRAALVRARRGAFGHFADHLRCYLAERAADPAAASLAERAARVRKMSHATVWEEMKRQRASHPALAQLFAQAPEALGW